MNLISLLIAIISINIIVFIHEFGHFIVAKFFNVPVYEFSIGMGKRIIIISFVYMDTRYSIKLFPFGGSCAIVGEDESSSGDFISIGTKIDYINNTIDYNGIKYDLNYIKNNNFSNISPIKKILICIADLCLIFYLLFYVQFC